MAESDNCGGKRNFSICVSESEQRYINKKLSEKPRGTTKAQLLLDAINGRPEDDEDPVEKIYEDMSGTETRLKKFLGSHKSVDEDAAEFADIVNECLREYSALMSAARGKGETHD